MPQFTVAAPHIVRPTEPAPLTLEDANYKRCGKRYCVDPSELKKEFRNKAKIGGYVGQSKAVIDYYKSVSPD